MFALNCVLVREEWTATERRVSNGERNAHIEGQENKEGKENKEPEPVVVEWKRRTVEEIISSSRRGGSVYIDDGSEQRIKVEDKLVGYELFIKLNETFTPHQSPAINVNVSTGNAPQAHPPTRVMGTKQIGKAGISFLYVLVYCCPSLIVRVASFSLQFFLPVSFLAFVLPLFQSALFRIIIPSTLLALCSSLPIISSCSLNLLLLINLRSVI